MRGSGPEGFSLNEDLREETVRRSIEEVIEICGYEEKELPVKVTKKRKDDTGIAHLYSKEDKVILGLHPLKWNSRKTFEKFTLLVHEATHLEYTGHMPRFWGEMTENIQKVLEERDRVLQHLQTQNQEESLNSAAPVHRVLSYYERNLIADMQNQTQQSSDFIQDTLDKQLYRLEDWLNDNDELRREFKKAQKTYVGDVPEKVDFTSQIEKDVGGEGL